MSPRRWAWAAALAAAALATALLLVAAALLALSSGWQRERLRAALEAALAGGLGAEVRIAALEGPLYPALALRGVAVGDPAAPLLALEGLALRLDAAPLLRTGRLEVESGLSKDWGLVSPTREGKSQDQREIVRQLEQDAAGSVRRMSRWQALPGMAGRYAARQ